ECVAFSPKTGTLLSLRDISPNRGCSIGSGKRTEGAKAAPLDTNNHFSLLIFAFLKIRTIINI
ncbi:MAG: hypothetical protein RRZ68_07795, partial [Oscillospiraceae bacterium]